jgi:hypothetical protein
LFCYYPYIIISLYVQQKKEKEKQITKTQRNTIKRIKQRERRLLRLQYRETGGEKEGFEEDLKKHLGSMQAEELLTRGEKEETGRKKRKRLTIRFKKFDDERKKEREKKRENMRAKRKKEKEMATLENGTKCDANCSVLSVFVLPLPSTLLSFCLSGHFFCRQAFA